MLRKAFPKVIIWEMGEIPPGSGSGGIDKFNKQITVNVDKCAVMIGLCDSHPQWGCPAEWKMG